MRSHLFSFGLSAHLQSRVDSEGSRGSKSHCWCSEEKRCNNELHDWILLKCQCKKVMMFTKKIQECFLVFFWCLVIDHASGCRVLPLASTYVGGLGSNLSISILCPSFLRVLFYEANDAIIFYLSSFYSILGLTIGYQSGLMK
jgi:hypothetical protein